MKEGKSLVELATELERQNEAKVDFKAHTTQLAVRTEVVGEKDVKTTLSIEGNGDFAPTDLFHKQLATRLSVPQTFYNRIRKGYPTVYDQTINAILRGEPEKRLVRTLDGNARAILSDRYRPLDNYDMAQAVLPTIAEMEGVRIMSCELTDTKLYIKAVSSRVEAEVKKGDAVQSGFLISNSEVGLGAVSIEPMIFRLRCTNGMIIQESTDYGMRRHHIGKGTHGEIESAFEFYADETVQADDRAFWLKIRDTVRVSIDVTRFTAIVDRLRAATDVQITVDPVQVVRNTTKRFQLTEGEHADVLRHLIEGADLSKFGLAQAITRTAQDVRSYDRATDFEALGGKVIDMAPSDWSYLQAEAA